MAGNDILIRKFEIDETRFNQSKNLLIFKVVYCTYQKNSLLEPDETIIVWKKLRDFERLYDDCEKLRLSLYIKKLLPSIKEIKFNKKELDQHEIEGIKKSFLSLLDHIGTDPCFYKNRIFTKFFEESELKIEKQVHPKEKIIKNLNNHNSNPLISSFNNGPNEQIIDSSNFPVPFENVHFNQNLDKLDKKFKPASSSSKSDLENLNDDCYLIDACHLICQAQLNEEKANYETAFESYKCAISILLKGVKNERDKTKRLNVRKKVEKYLSKAENIYDHHLIKEERSGSRKKFSLDTPYKQMMNDEMCTDKNCLSKFKLLSISGKIQIVLDLNLNEKFAIKSVPKISNLNNDKRYFIFPKVPNMVQLYKYYENDYAFYLVLEYFNCIKLSSILNEVRERLSPCLECLFDPAEHLRQTNENDELDDISDLEEILFDKDKFNEDEEEYFMRRSESVKTLSEIEDDLLDYQNKPKLISSKSEQKFSGLVHSKSTDFNQQRANTSLLKPNNNATKSTFNTLTGIFDRARNLIKNVDQTIRHTTIDQTRLSIDMDNIDLQCNLNNYILSRINDKCSVNVYYCDLHLNKQLEDCENEGKMLFNEEIVKKWLWQILICLEKLHDQNLIYIHLNPSKILISQDLADACLSYKYSLDYKQIDPLNVSQLIISSFYSTYSSSSYEYSYYVAPELFIYGSEITSAVDYWSFGCLAYELLANRPLCSIIPSINYKNLIQFPSFLSIESKDLIEKLLVINPSERLNCHSIKVHPFFKPL